MAAQTPVAAARTARRLLVPALPGVALLAVPLAVLAGPITSLLYGDQFNSAVRPAQILLVGMLFSAAAGVATGYLYGRGRPGRNSLALAVGLIATLVLDFALIPPYGATGAAVASCVAYLLGDGLLVVLLLRTSRRDLAHADTALAPDPAVA
jgi:O-antigen/teichoic acid export membrane protein